MTIDKLSEEDSLWLKAQEHITKRNAEAKSHFEKVTTEMQEVACINCDTEIKRDPEWSKGFPIHEAVTNNGTINTFSCGFGSKYDMNTYIIGICDECLEKLISQNKAVKI